MTAALAVLLWAVMAVAGLSLSPDGRLPVGLAFLGGPHAPVNLDDGGDTLARARPATLVKSPRAQVFGLSSGGSDDLHAPPGPAVAVDAHGATAALRWTGRSGLHLAASGQLSRRTPTGPPALQSLAL